MIPKIIHYCWFGRGNMPELAKKCIDSWHSILPDYEFRFWNEDTFDINPNQYVREAYENRKFAFVTDYVRLWALYNYGGVYMDTDVEMIKPIDCFMHHPAFSGFQTEYEVPTGIMASERGGKWVKHLLEYYDDKHFVKSDGKLDLTTNVDTICGIMREGGFRFDNTEQDYHGEVYIYPKDYFCAKSYKTGKVTVTENTYCIHHFSGSWKSPYKKMKTRILGILGDKNTKRLEGLKKRLLTGWH